MPSFQSQVSDCPPAETQHLCGWLSSYEGTDIEAEFKRIDATGWRKPKPVRSKN